MKLFTLQILFTVLLPVASIAAPPLAIDAGVRAHLGEKECSDARVDPLVAIRDVLSHIRAGFKNAIEYQASLTTALATEQTSPKSVPDLNWIRALDPWALPEGFPARRAFERCASHLRTYTDLRAMKSPSGDVAEVLTEWKSCVGLAFNQKSPPEFEALGKCLDGK
jgi:hypothetical protein